MSTRHEVRADFIGDTIPCKVELDATPLVYRHVKSRRCVGRYVVRIGKARVTGGLKGKRHCGRDGQDRDLDGSSICTAGIVRAENGDSVNSRRQSRDLKQASGPERAFAV